MDQSPKSSGPPPIDFVYRRPGDDTPKHQTSYRFALSRATPSKLSLNTCTHQTSSWITQITGQQRLQHLRTADVTTLQLLRTHLSPHLIHLPEFVPRGQPPPRITPWTSRISPCDLLNSTPPNLLPTADLPRGHPRVLVHQHACKVHLKFESRTFNGSCLAATEIAKRNQAPPQQVLLFPTCSTLSPTRSPTTPPLHSKPRYYCP